LAVTAGQGQAATGHSSDVLVFKNVSTTSCKLSGYPGVAGLDSAGQQVVQAVRTLNGFLGGVPAGSNPPEVNLAPSQSASSVAEGTGMPIGTESTCPGYLSLLVTPPNTRQSVTIDKTLPGCSPIEIHPVVPGTSGSVQS
jgi:hypothetical protein